MSACVDCGAEISIEQSHFNQGLCDECAFSTDAPSDMAQARKWGKLLEKMRKVEDWTVALEDGVVTVLIGGIDVTATFGEDEYVEALIFYEGYTAVGA